MIYRSSKIYQLALCYNPKINYILSKTPINYVSQIKEDSIYPAHLHTNKIVQTQSSLQVSILTSNYGTR